jgi:hypothetical protein
MARQRSDKILRGWPSHEATQGLVSRQVPSLSDPKQKGFPRHFLSQPPSPASMDMFLRFTRCCLEQSQNRPCYYTGYSSEANTSPLILFVEPTPNGNTKCDPTSCRRTGCHRLETIPFRQSINNMGRCPRTVDYCLCYQVETVKCAVADQIALSNLGSIV